MSGVCPCMCHVRIDAILVHCDALGFFGDEEEGEQECTLGEIQPCDCFVDGQFAIGTQVCGLNGEYGGCDCDSDETRSGNNGNEGGEGSEEGGEGGSGGGEGGSGGGGEGDSGGGEGGSGGGEGGSGGEGVLPVEAELLIDPETVNFGPNLVGQLSVISLTMTAKNGSVTITGISWGEGSNNAYQLDYSLLPGFWDGSEPSPNNPLILEENQSAEIMVRFTPEVESDKDENNQAIPEMGFVVIENDTAESVKEVEVKGIGVSGNCPVAVIVIQEGEQVIPQTVLNLFGDQSFFAIGNHHYLGMECPSAAGIAVTADALCQFSKPHIRSQCGRTIPV